MKVLLKDGRWRIVKNKSVIRGHPYIQHLCKRNVSTKNWMWFTHYPEISALRECVYCSHTIPDGMVVALLFLKVGE